MSARKYEFVTELARHGFNDLSAAISLANQFVTESVPALDTHESRVAFARTLPEVMQFVNDGLKIQAIKALRQAISDAGYQHPHSGLLACKNAIDELMPLWRRQL